MLDLTGDRHSDANTLICILVKTHPTQQLGHSLACLLNSSTWLSSVHLLHVASCEPNTNESVMLARLGVRTHIREIDGAQLAETINGIVANLPDRPLLFIRAGDVLSPHYCQTMGEYLSAHPDGHVFYPVAQEVDAEGNASRVFGDIAAADFKPQWDLPDPCALSGLCVRRDFFASMGGFHTQCQTVFEIDFWLRVLLQFPAALVNANRLEVRVARPDVMWILKHGARRVLEWSTLVRRFSGWCSARLLVEYAAVVLAVAKEQKGRHREMLDHLSDLSNHLLYMIHPQLRGQLQPLLDLSVQVSTDRPEFNALDALFEREFDASTFSALPSLFDGAVNVLSIGSFCHAAQVLKDLGIRRRTGPFDWIFSNAAAATHMLKDRFSTFMDAQYFRVVPDEEKADLSSNVCDHTYYKQHFGVKFMFNHHRPFEKKDQEFFRDAVQGFTSDLDGEAPVILLHIARMNGPAEDFKALWSGLQGYTAMKRLLVLRFSKVSEDDFLAAEPKRIEHVGSEVVEYVLPVVSASNGLQFSDPRDNRRTRRLIYSAAQVMLADLTSA